MIVLADLARHLAREITATDYLAAERRRDDRRVYQASYRAERSAAA
jgi:hypothetical protein